MFWGVGDKENILARRNYIGKLHEKEDGNLVLQRRNLWRLVRERRRGLTCIIFSKIRKDNTFGFMLHSFLFHLHELLI